MKVFINTLLVFSQMLILNACAENPNAFGVKVNLEVVEKKPSYIKVIFTNELEIGYWLSIYNFCQSEVLFQDIFVVKNIESKYLYASYSGPVDFVNVGSKTKDQFLKIEPKSSVSCEIDISQYYLTSHAGTYSVTYTAENPAFENQGATQLVSNHVMIELVGIKNNSN